jgi:tetratricopeptide (TPR) repeat protein
MKWIIGILAVLVTVGIMMSCQNRDPYMQSVWYGYRGQYGKARRSLEDSQETEYPPFKAPTFRKKQLLELINDTLEGKMKKNVTTHIFRGIYWYRKEKTRKMSGSEFHKLIFRRKSNSKRDELLDNAMAEFEKALAIDPNSALAHFGLGIVYRSKVMHDAAIEECKKAAMLKPNDSIVHLTLGNLYYNKRMLEESILENHKALALGVDGKDAIFLHNSLGLAYHRTERYDLAIKHLEEAVKLGVKSEVTDRFLRKAKEEKKKIEGTVQTR